ncbi:hypothetical protein ACU686_17640 [Yinghuangia aomiensis]
MGPRRRAVPRRHHRPRGLRPRGHLRHLPARPRRRLRPGLPAEPGIRHPVPGQDQGQYGYDTPAYENSAYESPAYGTPYGQQRTTRSSTPRPSVGPPTQPQAPGYGYESRCYDLRLAAPGTAQPGYALPSDYDSGAYAPYDGQTYPASGVRPDAAPQAPGQVPGQTAYGRAQAAAVPAEPQVRRTRVDRPRRSRRAPPARTAFRSAARHRRAPVHPGRARRAAPGCSCRPAHSGQPRPAPRAGRPGRANSERVGYDDEEFAFVDEESEESEDVIDWLKFAETPERRDERRKQLRGRAMALLLVLAGVGVGGGYFAYTTWFKGDARRRGADPAARQGRPGARERGAGERPDARHRLDDDRAVGDHRQHPSAGPVPARGPLDGERRRRCVPGSARAADRHQAWTARGSSASPCCKACSRWSAVSSSTPTWRSRARTGRCWCRAASRTCAVPQPAPTPPTGSQGRPWPRLRPVRPGRQRRAARPPAEARPGREPAAEPPPTCPTCRCPTPRRPPHRDGQGRADAEVHLGGPARAAGRHARHRRGRTVVKNILGGTVTVPRAEGPARVMVGDASGKNNAAESGPASRWSTPVADAWSCPAALVEREGEADHDHPVQATTPGRRPFRRADRPSPVRNPPENKAASATRGS